MKKTLSVLAAAGVILAGCSLIQTSGGSFESCAKAGGVIGGETSGNLTCSLDNQTFVATDAEKTAYLTVDSTDVQPVETSTDALTELFGEISKATQIDFSAPAATTLDWRDADNNITKVSGEEISAGAVSNEPEAFGDVMQNLGFTVSIANAADGPSESISGYQKDSTVCLIHTVLVPDVYAVQSVDISCGELN